MVKPRAIVVFEQYIQSPKTREQYLYHLTRFTQYYKLKSIDSILEIENTKFKEMIEDYVILFKNNNKSVSYIRLILFALQSFCDANDKVGVNWKKIRKLLGRKQKPKKSRPFTTEEIKLMLGTVKDLRSKAIILFLSSSGVRRGSIPLLKIKHLKEMPNDCLAVRAFSTKTNEEYDTFINKEAKESLTRYFERRKKDGERLDPDHPVFRTKYNLGIVPAPPISEKTVSNLIVRAKQNSGINLDNESNMLCHAFRRRFNTILKMNSNANPQLIERLMGHDMKLDNSYFQPTLDELFEEYKKGVSSLMIDDKERVLEEKRKVENEKAELEKKIPQLVNEAVERIKEELRKEGRIVDIK